MHVSTGWQVGARLAEERAHRGAHGLGTVEIGTRTGKHHGVHAEGVRRADDGADIAGILHTLQHDDVPQPLPQTHFRDAHGKDRPRRMHERRGILDEFGIGRILRNLVRQRERRRIAPEHGRDLRAELQRLAQQLFAVADVLPRVPARIIVLRQRAQVQDILIFPRPNLFHIRVLRIFYYNVIQICPSSYNNTPHFSSPEFQEFAKRCKFSAA